MSEPIVVVDLFCGAGGFSTGAALALEELGHAPGEDIELHAINHWGVAIETHEQNHPWAEHYHSAIENIDPLEIAEPGSVELMVGGPECTHFSNARGGQPVKDQKREPAWNVLTWIQKLRPENVLIENIQEFTEWGPIEDGKASRDGTVFDAWLNALNALGYAVDHRVLTCADYGDPTTRDRLFVVARRDAQPTYPPPTHSDDPEDGLENWRPASEVIDWSDPGTSIWTRDLEQPRVQPLAKNTMARIAEGLRRHCSARLTPFTDVLEDIGPDELEALRECVVPERYAATVASVVDTPFLVRSSGQPVPDTATLLGQRSSSTARTLDRPVQTIVTKPRIGLTVPGAFCLRQQSGGVPSRVDGPLPTISTKGAIGLCEVDERPLVQPKNGRQRGLHSNALYPPENRPFHTITTDPRAKLVKPSLVRYSHGGATLDLEAPMPTIATERGGVFALSNPFLCPLYREREGQRPRTRTVDRPLMTVPASKSPAGLASPFLVQYYGESDATPVHLPVPTVTSRDRFALCVPEAWPWGLDIRYRMLKPSELKQAQGFPPEYELAGNTKADITEQIGNAVPVNTAKALCQHLLEAAEPDLSGYGGGLADEDVDVPSYAEVAQSDD